MKRQEKNHTKKIMNKKKRIRRIKIITYILGIVSIIGFYQYKLEKLNNQYLEQIADLTVENENVKRVNNTYAEMLKANDETINTYKKQKEDAEAKYNYIQNQIKYSKLDTGNITANSDLTKYPVITIEEMNNYIDAVTEQHPDSPFKGKGEVFLKAAEENNIDPRYLVSHACLESNYGKSYLAQTKGNLFGINAVNHDPNQAYHMGSDIDNGIYNGAKWIAQNYIHNGKNTLNKMAYGSYALNDDGSPNEKWVNDIVHIANRKTL